MATITKILILILFVSNSGYTKIYDPIGELINTNDDKHQLDTTISRPKVKVRKRKPFVVKKIKVEILLFLGEY